MLESAKLVLVNDPERKDGLNMIARLYFHDEVMRRAHLMVDRLRIHELKSVSVLALGANASSSFIESHFDKQKVKDPLFCDFNFNKTIETYLERQGSGGKKSESNKSFINAVNNVGGCQDLDELNQCSMGPLQEVSVVDTDLKEIENWRQRHSSGIMQTSVGAASFNSANSFSM